MKDIELFSNQEIPQDKEYLFKYCKTKLTRSLLSSYLSLKNNKTKCLSRNILEHIGVNCSKRFVDVLIKRVTMIETRLKQAEKELDHVMITEIKTGKWRDGQIRSVVYKKKPRKKNCQVVT